MVEGIKRTYLLGEKRKIEFRLIEKQNDSVNIITKAIYEIVKDNNIIETGDAEVNKNIVSCLFAPTETGFYTVRFFVTVPPETIAAEMVAVVMKDK